MALEPKLVKLPIVKGAELWRQTTEVSDKGELRGDDANDDTEASLVGKHQTILGFTLDLRKRISRGEKVGVQGVAAVRRNC